jgi:hypothetical protein
VYVKPIERILEKSSCTKIRKEECSVKPIQACRLWMLANVSLGVPTLALILCRLPQIAQATDCADCFEGLVAKIWELDRDH